MNKIQDMQREGKPWYRNAIIYGIDISRFYDSNGDGIGDLAGIIEKLEYIHSLGVNCLWLLPFFPSPRKDNGYDITNYLDVDPRLGTLENFQTLVELAHRRGIRIIIELVFHHTSDEHPWFQKAIADPESSFHDYYIWADEPAHEPKEANVFPDEEKGVWKFLPQLGKYYHHRFYHFQPDLNIANANVIEEIKKMIDFWLDFDVDGFRIDSAMHMFEEKGSARVEIDGGDYLPQIRNHAERRKKDVTLLGEADVPQDQISGFVKNGNRLNLLFNSHLFLSLTREDKCSLQSILKNQNELLATMVWVNFAKTLDETNLGQLKEKEQEEVYARFAPKKNMQIYGRGIRRHITTILESERHLRMVYSLVFAIHGIPMIIYGSEIGMGDDYREKEEIAFVCLCNGKTQSMPDFPRPNQMKLWGQL